MNSQQAAGGAPGDTSRHFKMEEEEDLPADSSSSSWTVAAHAAVQTIATALQTAARDDLQPLDDAPNYQVLCGSARAACCAAESSMNTATNSAKSSLQRKELDCLCQLSTATLQLASAVCCDPEVALPLISSGSHTAALDQLKGAVKSLTNLWASCMTLLQQQQQDQHQEQRQGQHQQPHSASSSSQQALQALVPSLAASFKHLLHMSVTTAQFVSRNSSSSNTSTSSSSQQVPREMCSMSALNLAWANLTRLLGFIPEGVRVQVLTVQDLLHGLQYALQQLHTTVMELPLHARERQEVLVRFWLQSICRLISAVWEDAAQQALQPLLKVTLNVYDAVLQQREEFSAVQDILQGLLQPRLLACVSSLLISSTHVTAFQTKLDVLLLPQQQHQQQHHASSQSPPAARDSCQQQQQQLRAHVMVVLDLLQGVQLPGWPQELMLPACKQLLAWTLSTTGRELLTSVLAGSMAVGGPPAAAAALGDTAGLGGGVGSLDDSAALELLQGVLQGCLGALLTCWGVLQVAEQVEMLATVNQLALSAHPLVGFLARQLLTDLIAAAGSRELATQQLAVLHQLLGATAAAAAVPGAGWEASLATEAVADCLAAVLQACDQAFAAEWLQHHVMQGLGSNNSSSMAWMHAGACCQLVQESALLQRLVSTAPQLMPANQAQLQECWTQLCLTAQQVTGLIEPVQLLQLQQLASSDASSSNNSSSIAQQQAHMVLVLHQLSWLFSAMQSLLQLCSMLDAPMATGLKQGAFSLSVEVLKAVAPANPAAAAAPGAGAGAVAAAQFACTRSVLRLLAIPGQLAPPEAQVQELLVLLQGLADTHAGLHAVLAGVLGTLGVAANTDATFQTLFKQLLSSPHWAVKHAAFDALLQLLRHANLGAGIVRLLPPFLKSSETEATAEVVNTVKAHLHKQSDPQAQAAFSQHYAHMAGQHAQQLSAHAAQRTSSTAAAASTNHSSSNSVISLLADSLQAHVARLQGVLDQGCSAGTAADGSALVSPAVVGGAAAAQAGAAGGPQTSRGGAPDTADGVGGALMAQAATAAQSLRAADQALAAAEADIQLLLSAAGAAVRDRALGAQDILSLSKQGSNLMGSMASMVSRLRAMQDGLSTLKR